MRDKSAFNSINGMSGVTAVKMTADRDMCALKIILDVEGRRCNGEEVSGEKMGLL